MICLYHIQFHQSLSNIHLKQRELKPSTLVEPNKNWGSLVQTGFTVDNHFSNMARWIIFKYLLVYFFMVLPITITSKNVYSGSTVRLFSCPFIAHILRIHQEHTISLNLVQSQFFETKGVKAATIYISGEGYGFFFKVCFKKINHPVYVKGAIQ